MNGADQEQNEMKESCKDRQSSALSDVGHN